MKNLMHSSSKDTLKYPFKHIIFYISEAFSLFTVQSINNVFGTSYNITGQSYSKLVPHWLRNVFQGPSTEFWKNQTIASKVVQVDDDDEWVNGFGWFPCQSNHPIICALDFGLSFFADMNVSNIIDGKNRSQHILLQINAN